MSLKETIMVELKTAMKEKNADKLSCLRFLQAQIKNKEIENRPNEITDEDILQVIKKLVKQRKEGIDQFTDAGRVDLADKEKAELAILETFLPEQMSEEQVTSLVESVIKELGATTMKDMGNVMKVVLEKSGGSADNKMVSQLVRKQLQ